MYNLFAQFPKQQIVKDRQYSALNRWSAAVLTLPIPGEKPEENWVEQRVLAAKIPTSSQMHIDGTLGWVIRSDAIQTNIRQHLHSFNDEATEAAMDANLDNAMGMFMPAYAHTVILQAEIDEWYKDNGFAEPPAGALSSGGPTGPNPATGGTR